MSATRRTSAAGGGVGPAGLMSASRRSRPAQSLHRDVDAVRREAGVEDGDDAVVRSAASRASLRNSASSATARRVSMSNCSGLHRHVCDSSGSQASKTVPRPPPGLAALHAHSGRCARPAWARALRAPRRFWPAAGWRCPAARHGILGGGGNVGSGCRPPAPTGMVAANSGFAVRRRPQKRVVSRRSTSTGLPRSPFRKMRGIRPRVNGLTRLVSVSAAPGDSSPVRGQARQRHLQAFHRTGEGRRR